MEFKEFASLLFGIIGAGNSTSAFTKTLFEIIVDDDGKEIVNALKSSTFKAYFNGTNGISTISKKIMPYISSSEFEDYIDSFQDTTVQLLVDSFAEYLTNVSILSISSKLAELFISILKKEASISKKGKKSNTILENVSDKLLVPINPVRYLDGMIYIGADTIKLPIQLIPKENIDVEELPFINALCEVYSEKLNKIINTDSLDDLPQNYAVHLLNQKKAFFSAESIYHSVREVFDDGEIQFKALKDDAYEGIEMVYANESYASGYDRLQAVLEKITNTTLTRSTLMNIAGLINNLEKKGICHILVNDDVIKSWVKNYE